MKQRKRRSALFIGALVSALVVVPLSLSAASANTSVGYDFNTPGMLANEFDGYVQSQTVQQISNGGLGDSGSINAPSTSSTNAVFTTKTSYSIGPVGSTYTFTSFIKSVGNSGYSGMGFTASAPSASTTSSGPFRPSDALGISVHGGGFIFNNGGTLYSGNWNSPNSSPISHVTVASITDLLNNGSADKWYKVVLRIARATDTTFNMHVEIWPSHADGSLLHGSADAIFELNGVTNSTLMNSPVIHSYINFSGYRVTNFDGYSVDLAGGATVVAPGAPVVLTTGTSQSNNVITGSGNVTAENGSTVTERGFVYSTSTSPTTADNKVIVGSGAGTFSGTTATLAGGTYYVRAYATNGTTTSYGSENSITLPTTVSQTVTWAPSNTSTPTTSSTVTPNASASTNGTGAISYSVVNAGTTGCSVDGSTPPVISYSAAGDCVVRATAAANAPYTSAYTDVTFSAYTPQAQTVTWAPSNTSNPATSSTVTPDASASTNGTGAISYSVADAGATGCSIDGSTPPVITYTAAGDCVVRATAAANVPYTSAYTDVTFSLVSQSQTVTWNPTNVSNNQFQSPLTPNATASSSGPGAISYSLVSAGTTNCTVDPSTGAVTFNAPGTCVARATAASTAFYDAGSVDVTFTVVHTNTALSLALDVPTGAVVNNAPVNYSSSGLQPGSSWNIELHSTPQVVASGTVGIGGMVQGTQHLPTGLEPGWHTLTLNGTSVNGGLVSTTVWFEIDEASTLLAAQTTPPTETPAAASLASTGVNPFGDILIALFICAAGGALVYSRMRKARF